MSLVKPLHNTSFINKVSINRTLFQAGIKKAEEAIQNAVGPGADRSMYISIRSNVKGTVRTDKKGSKVVIMG